jgi:hypothetical protein
VETRVIGVSLGFSTAVSIFGGHALLVATWLTSAPETGYYLIFTALLSLFALMAIQWRSRSSTCAPGAACRALRRHLRAARCKPAAVRPKSLLWIDVPLRIPVTRMAAIAPQLLFANIRRDWLSQWKAVIRVPATVGKGVP